MKEERTSREKAIQIIREVSGAHAPKNKKTKKSRRFTETDIDIFAEDEIEQQEN